MANRKLDKKSNVTCVSNGEISFHIDMQIKKNIVLSTIRKESWYDFNPILQVRNNEFAQIYWSLKGRDYRYPKPFKKSDILTVFTYSNFVDSELSVFLAKNSQVKFDDLDNRLNVVGTHFQAMCTDQLSSIDSAQKLNSWLRKNDLDSFGEGFILSLFLGSYYEDISFFEENIKSLGSQQKHELIYSIRELYKERT